MSKENRDKEIQVGYLSNIFNTINVEDFISDEGQKTRIRRAAPLNIPDVAPAGGAGAAPGGPVGSPAGGPPIPPPGPMPGLEGPPPMGGAPTDLAGGPPPPPPGPKPEVLAGGKEEDEQLEVLSEMISKLQDSVEDLKDDVRFQKLEEYVHTNIEELQSVIKDLRDRKIPIRDAYDSEGVYRDKLYGMVTEVLDKFLPDLFEEIPEYTFLASQVSRQFDDGTVADALVSVNVKVAREGSRYDFTIQIAVLNGLIQYPQYMYRGLRIIPLTKDQIQKELNSMSYRKMDIDTPFSKENNFSTIGENINRRQTDQKTYLTQFSKPIPASMPPNHSWSSKQKDPYR
ncbi:MAG TPA: hypothetical protein P5136_00385 [Methanofastidiosum sp.]|nr:hypothetical protein [Methanofastidiosum sp.]